MPPAPTDDTTFELRVERVVPGGRVLGRRDGKVVLVAGALPGERVAVRLTRSSRGHDEAETVRVLEPHPARRRPPCPHAAECGGCDFQHAERDLQLDMKRSILIDAYRRIGKLEIEPLLEGPRAIGEEFRARNRITLTYDDRGRPGLMRRTSHRVVPIDDCLLVPETFREAVLPWLRTLSGWRRAAVRFDSERGVRVLLDAGEGRRRESLPLRPPPSVRGVLDAETVMYGDRKMVFRVRNRVLTADATSFFQVHPKATEELVDAVDTMLGSERSGRLLDLYAGVGLFAVVCGTGFEWVVASERERRSVVHLRRNLRRNGIPGEGRREEAERTLASLAPSSDETILLDPPRAGLSPACRRGIVRRAPRRVVLVSCDPATGARDSASLVGAGWRLDAIRVVDLFPATAHVESVSRFVRGQISAASTRS